MSIKLSVPNTTDPSHLKPNITVIGVGGAGGNAVNNMIELGLEGVEFLVANSDSQALSKSAAERRIQMGVDVTRGLGAGSNPDIGRAAAEESLEEILGHVQHSNMLFVTAGLGGGTGTGAAPVIARAARDFGILTVGVVTKPFHFEGDRRMRLAEAGLQELQQFVDTLLIIPNQNLFYVANEQTTFADAFQMADQVLYSGVRGVTDLMVSPGLINLDFADIKSVMSEMGKAMMGTGEAEGDNRAIEAAEAAISNPLLDDSSMAGARGVLINITAGKDITLFEVDEAANRIRKEVFEDANIIFGSTFDDTVEGRIRVSVVATGIETDAKSLSQPNQTETNNSRAAMATATETEPAAEDTAPREPVPVAVFPRPTAETATPELLATAECADRPVYTKPTPSVASITAPAQTNVTQPTVPEVASEVTPEVVVASPSAAPQTDAFIPAPPVMGNVVVEDKPKADPFTVADMVNTRIEQEETELPKKTLFERMTGVSRPERRVPKRDRTLPPKPEPGGMEVGQALEDTNLAEATTSEPTLDEVPAATEVVQEDPDTLAKPALAQETPVPVAVGDSITIAVTDQESQSCTAESALESAPESKTEDQGAFGGLDPDEHLSDSNDTDDLLEIPAFLRRQAN